MEAVQNIARLGSGTGEGRRTNRPCKILHDLQAERERVARQSPVQNIARESRLALSHRRIILPFSSGRILSYFILLFRLITESWGICALHRGTPGEGSPRQNSPPDCFGSPPALLVLLGFRRLRSATKGAAFGIRKPLKRLERNF